MSVTHIPSDSSYPCYVYKGDFNCFHLEYISGEGIPFITGVFSVGKVVRTFMLYRMT